MSKTFAANLKAYRLMARMTQTDLANAVGSNRANINNYERNLSEPSFELLCKLAAVLGIEITDLIEEHDIPDYIRSMQVTDDESALLQAYREAEPVYQEVALDILRSHKRRET